MKQYTKQELWDVYEKLPEDLQQAIFSVEVAEHINNTCERSNVSNNKVSQVAKFTGRVLMGLLTPEEFKIRLKEEVKLSEPAVKNVFRGINRLVFMPVRETLSALYGTEIKPTKKPEGLEEAEETSEVKTETGQEQKERSQQDKYREPID